MPSAQKEIAKQDQQPGTRPAWLAERAEDAGLGMDVVRDKKAPVRRRVMGVNPKDRAQLSLAGMGGFYVSPDDQPFVSVDSNGEASTVDVVPLLQYVSYQKRSDYNDKDSDFIIEEEYDPNGKLARLAENPATRTESYGPGYKYTYCESINHIWQVAACPACPELVGKIVAHSYAIGSHYSGKKLNSFIDESYSKDDPIFVRRITLTSEIIEKNSNSWPVLVAAKDQGQKYIDPDTYDEMKAKHFAAIESMKRDREWAENKRAGGDVSD